MEKLRKARIDTRLMIKDLEKMLGLTRDMVITWELERISPSSRKLRSVEMLLAKLRPSQIEDRASFRIQ